MKLCKVEENYVFDVPEDDLHLLFILILTNLMH